VQEHLALLINDAEGEFQADATHISHQEHLSELLVYRSRLQSATAALIQPRIRPPAGAPATPDGGLCCGNRSPPTLLDSRLNAVVVQPHPPANYAARAHAVLSRPFTISGWP
jgi:hypothetical protein